MISSLKILVPHNRMDDFANWQGGLNSQIAAFPGFISLEILSQLETKQSKEWVIVERFKSDQDEHNWRNSKEYGDLRDSLAHIAESVEEKEVDLNCQCANGVTEVIVTRINTETESDYRKWISKLHLSESKFPGFRGVIVQSPHEGQGDNWITLLQFDTPENLDNWLNSSERKNILAEGKGLVAALENHRVISPYAGWFSSISSPAFSIPVWKQTMVILLILFPIIQLEQLFLMPHLQHLNSAVRVFLGSALSVSLISWPFMPLAIKGLSWWLTTTSTKVNLLGLLLLLALYAGEIFLFWI